MSSFKPTLVVTPTLDPENPTVTATWNNLVNDPTPELIDPDTNPATVTNVPGTYHIEMRVVRKTKTLYDATIADQLPAPVVVNDVSETTIVRASDVDPSTFEKVLLYPYTTKDNGDPQYQSDFILTPGIPEPSYIEKGYRFQIAIPDEIVDPNDYTISVEADIVQTELIGGLPQEIGRTSLSDLTIVDRPVILSRERDSLGAYTLYPGVPDTYGYKEALFMSDTNNWIRPYTYPTNRIETRSYNTANGPVDYKIRPAAGEWMPGVVIRFGGTDLAINPANDGVGGLDTTQEVLMSIVDYHNDEYIFNERENNKFQDASNTPFPLNWFFSGFGPFDLGALNVTQDDAGIGVLNFKQVLVPRFKSIDPAAGFNTPNRLTERSDGAIANQDWYSLEINTLSLIRRTSSSTVNVIAGITNVDKIVVSYYSPFYNRGVAMFYIELLGSNNNNGLPYFTEPDPSMEVVYPPTMATPGDSEFIVESGRINSALQGEFRCWRVNVDYSAYGGIWGDPTLQKIGSLATDVPGRNQVLDGNANVQLNQAVPTVLPDPDWIIVPDVPLVRHNDRYFKPVVRVSTIDFVIELKLWELDYVTNPVTWTWSLFMDRQFRTDYLFAFIFGPTYDPLNATKFKVAITSEERIVLYGNIANDGQPLSPDDVSVMDLGFLNPTGPYERTAYSKATTYRGGEGDVFVTSDNWLVGLDRDTNGAQNAGLRKQYF